MRLIKSLILLVTILLISNSVYSQYPQVKKIGKDSVVLITLKQGNDINKQFSVLRDTIKVLKTDVDSLKASLEYYQKMSDLKWQKENSAHAYEYYRSRTLEMKIDSLQAVNKKNREMYEQHDKITKVAIRHITVFATILGFMTVIFAAL